MKYTILSVIICCFMFTASFAQKLQPSLDSALITIKVTDFDKNPEPSTIVKLVDQKDEKVVAEGLSDESGIFRALVATGGVYNLDIHKFDTVFHMGAVPVPKESQPQKQNILSKIKLTEPDYVDVYNLAVNFKSNEHTLDNDDIYSLTQLFNQLNESKTMKVEIAAHTDNVGNDLYNMKLSQRRANSVKDYLLSMGIDPSRIQAKGYGESKPVATNDTPEGKAKNRRVEVRVIQK